MAAQSQSRDRQEAGRRWNLRYEMTGTAYQLLLKRPFREPSPLRFLEGKSMEEPPT